MCFLFPGDVSITILPNTHFQMTTFFLLFLLSNSQVCFFCGGTSHLGPRPMGFLKSLWWGIFSKCFFLKVWWSLPELGNMISFQKLNNFCSPHPRKRKISATNQLKQEAEKVWTVIIGPLTGINLSVPMMLSMEILAVSMLAEVWELFLENIKISKEWFTL